MWRLRALFPLCVRFLPWLLLCTGVLNGTTLEKAEKKIKESFSPLPVFRKM